MLNNYNSSIFNEEEIDENLNIKYKIYNLLKI